MKYADFPPLISGIVATVFGATGFLGRYVVQQLGKLLNFLHLSKLYCSLCTICQLSCDIGSITVLSMSVKAVFKVECPKWRNLD